MSYLLFQCSMDNLLVCIHNIVDLNLREKCFFREKENYQTGQDYIMFFFFISLFFLTKSPAKNIHRQTHKSTHLQFKDFVAINHFLNSN